MYISEDMWWFTFPQPPSSLTQSGVIHCDVDPHSPLRLRDSGLDYARPHRPTNQEEGETYYSLLLFVSL